MINLDSYPQPVSGVVGRVLEDQNGGNGEAVLVLPAKSQVKVLNPVGARIWALIDGRRTVGEIAAVLVEEYEVELAEAQEDTLQFISELAGRGIVTFSAVPGLPES